MRLPDQSVLKTSVRRTPWAVALAATLLACHVAPAAMTTNSWNVVNGSYGDSTAWNPQGVPNSTNIVADVGNYGTVSYDSTQTNALGTLYLGEVGGNGSFIMSGGELDITNGNVATGLWLGNAPASTGSFVMNGGTLNLRRNSGTYHQDFLEIGVGINSVGTFTLNNGFVNCVAGMEIGCGGVGTLTVNGGTLIDNGWFGLSRGGTGLTNAAGTFNQTGGTVYVLRNPSTETGNNGISFAQGGTNANANISGGSLYVTGLKFAAGGASLATTENLNVSGGDIYLGSTGVVSNSNAGTHLVSIKLSGGTFHSVNFLANTGGLLGLGCIGTGGTNWSWPATLPATLAASPGPGVVTFAPEATRTFTLSAAMSGPGALKVNGPGTVVLGAAEAYTGGTIVSAGTLAIAAVQTNTLGLSLSSGTTLALNTGGSLVESPLTLPAGVTLSFNANNTQYFTNDVNGAGNVLVALTGSGAELVVGSMGHGGQTIINSGMLVVGGTLTSSTVLVTNTGTLAGNGTIGAPVTITSTNGTAAVHLRMGMSPLNIPDTLTINNSVNLGVGSELDIKLGTATTMGSGANDLLVVNGNLTIDPTAVLNIVPLQQLTAGTYVIATYTGTLSGQFASVVTGLTRYSFSVDYSTAHQIKLIVGGSNASLVWYGMTNNVAAPLWDVQNSANWRNAGVGTTFSEGDAVTFDDTATNCTVQLFTTLYPASITFNNVNSNYSISGTGSGRITGGTGITKNGSGTVTLAAGVNGGNDYTGPVTINGGILKMNGALTLGATNGATYVNSGGTLDLNGQTPNDEPFVLQGTGFGGTNGAINNSGAAVNQNNGPRKITLTGDTLINASGARWDIGKNTLGAGGGYLAGNGYALTKMGNNDIYLHEVGDTGLGDITIGQGTLGFQYNIGLGNPAKTVFVSSNATLALWQVQGVLNKNVSLTNAALYSNGGTGTSNVLNGTITLTGTNSFNPNSFPLDLSGPIGGSGALQKVSAGPLYLESANTYTGPTLLNAGSIVLRGAGALANSPLINLVGSAMLDASQAASGLTLGAGQTVAGSGSLVGAITVGNAATLAPGTAIVPATLSLSNNLTLNGGSTNIIKLSASTTVGQGVNDLIMIGGSLTLNGTVTLVIVPTDSLDGVNAYTVMQYGAFSPSGSGHFTAVCKNPRYNVTVDTTSMPGSVLVKISGSAAPLLWKGDVAGSLTNWDHTTTNWVNSNSGQRDKFFDGDLATFDDTGVSTQVYVNGTETAGTITMANNAKDYTFSGGLLTAGTLDMEGSHTLTLAMTNAPVISTITANNGTLVFNVQGVSVYTNNATITDGTYGMSQGPGTIVQSGTNTLVLGRDSTTMGATIIVNNGTLRYTNGNNLGASFVPLYAQGNGTLDMAGVQPGIKEIRISGAGYNGQGAIIDSKGLSSANGLVYLTLAGDAAIGAPGPRWDFNAPGANTCQITGNGHKLTKVGTGTIIIYDQYSGDTGLGDIDIAQGRLGFQLNNSNNTVLLGDAYATMTIESNATLTFYNVNNGTMSKNLVLNGVSDSPANGVACFDSAANTSPTGNSLVGAVTLNGTNNLFGLRSSLSLPGNIGGSGGFIVGVSPVGGGSGTLYLSGQNTYTGPTVISNNFSLVVAAGSSLGSSSRIQVNPSATLNVSALSALNLGTGQTLMGAGTITGNVAVASGATLAPGFPGNSTYTLNLIGSLTLQAGSTNVVVVNKTATAVNSDNVANLTSVAMAGTLVVNSVGNALAGGDAIRLFTASGGYTGGFNTIIPATPGANLVWDTSTLLSDGMLRVKSNGPPSTPTNMVASVSGNKLTLSWPTSYIGWTLQAQTNAPGYGLTTQWHDVPGSAITNKLILPLDPTTGSVFYRMVLH